MKMNSKLGLGRLLLELPISWMKTLEGGAVWLAIANKTAGQRHACVLLPTHPLFRLDSGR